MNRIAAVVVTYNRKELLLNCVKKLLSQELACDVLVVDNASTDGTAEALHAVACPHLKYRNTGKNLGGAGGFHFGMRWAIEENYDYLWIMDDDTLPESDALAQLWMAHESLQGRYGWLSSGCYWIDGELCPMNLQRSNPYKELEIRSEAYQQARMASFVSLFLSAEIVEQFGLPIQEFFIWTDDWEYTRRISRELPCYVVWASRVVHAMKDKTTVNIATDTADRMFRYRYFYRNDVYLYRREGIKGWLWIFSKNIWHSLQVIGKSHAKLNKLQIIWSGFWRGIRFEPSIDYCQRPRIRKMRGKRKNMIAAVVVTRNRKELLVQCVERLLAQQTACDVLVVDNASTDGTSEALQRIESPYLRYWNTGQNFGGAGGFNVGMRWAVEDGYDYLWLMDDDTLPEPDALTQLWLAHERLKGEYGFLSSVVLWKDGKECRMNRQKVKKDFYKHIELLRYSILQIEQSSFVSLFLTAQVVEKAGLPIKDFFIWGDDLEYTRRISIRMKQSSYLVGKSLVQHFMTTNSGSSLATDRPDRINRYWYAFRNDNYSYRKEGFGSMLYYLMRCGREFWRIIFQAKDYRLKRLSVLLGGMIKGFFFFPRVETTVAPTSKTGSS